MLYSGQNAAFFKDKKDFFSKVDLTQKVSDQIQWVSEQVQSVDYSFLLQHQGTLETEFTDLFFVLKKQKNDNQEAFWLYCFYCASLLETFYRAYAQKNKEKEWSALKEQIVKRLNKENADQATEETFIQSLYLSFLTSLKNVLTAPCHISQVRDYVAYTNLCRLYWAFCRMTVTQGLLLAKDAHWIEKLDVILGTHTNVDKIISVLQAPSGVISYLSVAFFLARFMIDGAMLIKHTLCPSAFEKNDGASVFIESKLPEAGKLGTYRKAYVLVKTDDVSELYYIPKNGSPLWVKVKAGKNLSELLARLGSSHSSRLSAQEIEKFITENTDHTPEQTTVFERFKFELYKRHCNFANDLVWAAVNFLTNLNHLSKISNPVAGYITAAFLVFDVGMVLYKCQLAKKEYLSKKAQYTREMEEYSHFASHRGLTEQQKLTHIEMLQGQLTELEIHWHSKESMHYFVAAAAALLMTGFTASMVLSPPILVVGCFFVCTLAIAMYLSSGAYSQYQEKSMRLDNAQMTGNNLRVIQKEYEVARNEFFFSMAKNTVMPMVLVTTYAICWPAAIALTAMYIGVEFFHGYQQHHKMNEAKQSNAHLERQNDLEQSLSAQMSF